MGVEVFTNKADTEAVLVCNTTGNPLPGIHICDSNSYEETYSEDHYVPAYDMAEAFLKWHSECYAHDIRTYSMGEANAHFSEFRDSINIKEI